jgi:hypothetical protein
VNGKETKKTGNGKKRASKKEIHDLVLGKKESNCILIMLLI